MDIAYLHLITNHIPIIGVPFALFLLVLGIWRKSDELKTASFLIFAFLGIATLATYLLGQGGEDFVETVAGVSGSAIEEHENFARLALAAVAVTALCSLFALLRYRGLSYLKRRNSAIDQSAERALSIPPWMSLSVLIAGLASGALLGYTGKLGGKMRHPEFYGGAASAEEETDGKKRRGKTDQRPEKVLPFADTQAEAPATAEPEESQANGGKKRRRGGGAKN